MPFTKVADDGDLKMLTTVLDDYCLERGIANHTEERRSAGQLIMTLFHDGAHSIEQLKAALLTTRRTE